MTRARALPPVAAIALAMAAAACVSGKPLNTTGWTGTEDYFVEYRLAPPDLNATTVCHGYNCRYKTRITFSDGDIDTLRAAFAANGATAAAEREEMSQAVAFLETITGAVIGTADDPGAVLENEHIGDPTRQDCVDEAATTTGYLVLLANNGMLRHHTVSEPAQRGWLIDGRWQHYTAVVEESATGERYVVDSWFRDNGQPAVVMSLSDWLFDWTPSSTKRLPEEEAT